MGGTNVSSEPEQGGHDEGLGLVVRIVGATVVAALAGIRVYAFIHDFWHEIKDPYALVTAAIAIAVLAGAIWVLARTLREAD